MHVLRSDRDIRISFAPLAIAKHMHDHDMNGCIILIYAECKLSVSFRAAIASYSCMYLDVEADSRRGEHEGNFAIAHNLCCIYLATAGAAAVAAGAVAGAGGAFACFASSSSSSAVAF